MDPVVIAPPSRFPIPCDLRRDRVRVPVRITAIAVFLLSSVASFPGIYGTAVAAAPTGAGIAGLCRRDVGRGTG